MPVLHTHTLDVAEATLHYDIRPGRSGTEEPALLLAGSPMDAAGFNTLATYFTDRTVVTYDPRGAGRSTRTTYGLESTPEQHADDLHRIIDALGVGAVDLFGSSGGAVNGLALVAKHPEDVRTCVAHEPPLAMALPDGAQVMAAARDIYETYQRNGVGPAMAKFLMLIGRQGPLPENYLDEPDPDPADFGLPTDDDGSRDDPTLGQNMRTCVMYHPDFDALTAASTRIVVAAGKESAGELAARAAAGIAELLAIELTMFPSHHGGFLGGEYGQHGDPDRFASALRKALHTDDYL